MLLYENSQFDILNWLVSHDGIEFKDDYDDEFITHFPFQKYSGYIENMACENGKTGVLDWLYTNNQAWFSSNTRLGITYCPYLTYTTYNDYINTACQYGHENILEWYMAHDMKVECDKKLSKSFVSMVGLIC